MKSNHKSWDAAINSRKAWTEAEINLLKSLIEEGLSHKEIARRLGRSKQAITVAKQRYLKGE